MLAFDPALTLAGVQAALQAVATWIQYRDSKRAAEAFKRTEIEAREDKEVREAGEAMSVSLPVAIIDAFNERVERCYSSYLSVLEGDEYLPAEVDSATGALKACVCRELRRLKELQGYVADSGPLREAWEAWCVEGD